jgi:hypothetical protein
MLGHGTDSVGLVLAGEFLDAVLPGLSVDRHNGRGQVSGDDSLARARVMVAQARSLGFVTDESNQPILLGSSLS